MATRTLGLTGRNFSTLAALQAVVNALSFTENEITEVYNDGGPVADTTSVTVGGYTANGFSYTIRPAAGQGIKDNANKLTNALRWNSSNGAALTLNAGYSDAYILAGENLTVEDLQLRATNATSGNTIRPSNGVVVQRCILWKTTGGFVASQAHHCTLRDSLLVAGTGGNGVDVTNDSLDIDGCTIAIVTAGGVGIRQVYTQSIAPRVRNTAIFNFTTDVQGTFRTGSTNNATSKASWGGTGISGQTSLASTDFENVSSGTEDFRPSASAEKLPANGAVGIGSGFDVVNTARSGTTPSVGAWEAAGGTSGTAPGVTVTSAASIIVGSATGQAAATANGATVTAAAGLIAGTATGEVLGTLAFNAAGLEFGRRTGAAISTFALDAGASYRYTVHADALTLGAAIITSAAITLDSNGRLPNLASTLIAPGTTYRIVAIRQADGEAATFRLTAS